MKPDIGPESCFLPTLRSPAFNAPIGGGGSRRNIAMTFGLEKLEWCDYPMVKKNKDMFIRFDRIHEGTDGRTYGQTNTAWRHRPRLHSIARQKLQYFEQNIQVSTQTR